MKNEPQFTGERVVPNRTCHALTMAEHLIRYSLATKYAKVGKILDVACGTGYGLKIMGMLGATPYGSDKDMESVEYAARSNHATGFILMDFEKDNLFNFFFGRAAQTDVDKIEKFDLITSFETIEHLADPNLFLQGIKDCLADGGKFIYSIPLANPSTYHKVVYTFESAQELIEKYFEHEEIFIQESLELVNFKRMNGNVNNLNKRGIFVIGVCHKKNEN